MPNVYTLLPALLTALIALGAYLYKNRIGFTIITIGGSPEVGNGQLKVCSTFGRIQAERLKIKNFGIRTLVDVELHLTVDTQPVSMTINALSTLSKNAVKTEWIDKVIKISIPVFPSNEELYIDFIRVGNYEPISDRLRGTGGKYKIVRLELQAIKRDILTWTIVYFAITISVQAVITWVNTR